MSKGQTAGEERPAPDEAPLPPWVRFATPVVGPAYRPFARMTTLTTVVGLAAYGARVLSARPDVAWPVLVLMAAAGAVLLVSAWYILTGKTTVDARGIRQDWMFPKRFGWHEIARVRFVRMPVVPRLVVMTGRGPFKAIQSGCRELDQAFEEIVRLYGGRPR
jgi:hypothetical protein